MDRIDTLIRDLEKASVSEERGVILDALTYAHASKWIDTATFHNAQKMLHVGAFLSAVLVLVPEGWSIAGLWEAVQRKDRPWWGVNLRRDDPYKVLTVQGSTTPALGLSIAAIKARRGA